MIVVVIHLNAWDSVKYTPHSHVWVQARALQMKPPYLVGRLKSDNANLSIEPWSKSGE